MALKTLRVGAQTPVVGNAFIRGAIKVPPFKLSQTQGLQFMRVGDLDAEIDLPVQSLDFLASLMPVLSPTQLTGHGRLRGRAVLSRGEALRGTDLVVEARELALSLGIYHFKGDGSIEFLVDPEDEAQADLNVRFDRVQGEMAERPDRAAGTGTGGALPLFTGRGLTARLHAEEVDPTTTSSAVRAEELLAEVRLKLLLSLPSVQVADIAVYSRLFPQEWGLKLLGGSGTLSGEIAVASETLSLNLNLASQKADLRFRDYRATSDLLLQLKANMDEASGAKLRLDGTSLRIADAKIAAMRRVRGIQKPPRAKLWNGSLTVSEGALNLPIPAEGTAHRPVPAVANILKEKGVGALLAGADGRLSASLTVSQLDWIAELLERPLNLSLTGAGRLDAQIVLADGQPTRGTTLEVPPEMVIGRVGSAQARDWHARVQLEDTQVLWRKPMHLDMTAGIRIKDTRPVIALLDNVRGEHSWIDNLLADEDLGGHLKLLLDGERAVLADALLGSKRISVGAKGLVDAASREGMLYLRWRDLTGTLQLSEKGKHFQVGGARDRFDSYTPGKGAPVTHRPGSNQLQSTATSSKRLERRDTPHGKREDAAPSQAPISSTRDQEPRRSRDLFLDEDL